MTTPDPAPTTVAGLLRALRRPGVTVAVAAVSMLAVVGVGQTRVTAVPPVGDAPRVEPVASTTLVCPVTTATSALISTVIAGVAELDGVSTGVATLADLTTRTAASDPLLISKPGQTVARVFRDKSGPAQLARATGSFAAGFGADQVIRSGVGATRGLGAAPCSRPVTDTWLVGGGTTVGRLTQVLLVNDDDSPAQVDLLVYGPKGPVDAPGGAGIVLPASSRRQVRLDTLAPGLAVAAVHVVTRNGRVGVTGLDQQSNGLIPLGMSLLPPTAPSATVVIPNIPAPVRTARLSLISPDGDATASLTLLTGDGPVVPSGLAQVVLPAGRVVTVDLTPALVHSASGLRITSTAPVAGAVEVRTGEGTDLKEMDSAAGTPLLNAPGIVAGLRRGITHRIDVAAPAAQAVVRMELYVPGTTGAVWAQSVTVPRGATRRSVVPVTTLAASSFVVVTPVSGGPVYAGREVSEAGARGPMIALAPIYPTRATTSVPVAVSVPGSSVR